MREAKNQVAGLLSEDYPDSKTRFVRRDLQQAREKVKQIEEEQKKRRTKNPEKFATLCLKPFPK